MILFTDGNKITENRITRYGYHYVIDSIPFVFKIILNDIRSYKRIHIGVYIYIKVSFSLRFFVDTFVLNWSYTLVRVFNL